MDTGESFQNKIAQLIRLFKKLRDEARPEAVAGFDPRMLTQIDFLISNFEKMKDDPQAQVLFSQMGKPFEDMLNQFIQHMSEQLDDPSIPLPEEKEPLLPPLPEPEKLQTGTLTRRLVQIDQLLAKGGLSPEDEDELLDERIRIMRTLDPEGNP